MEIMGYIAIGMGVIFMIAALYAQSALSELLDHFRQQPDLMDRTGFISDLYFLYDLPKCKYGFVRFLYKHPEPPPGVAQAFPDYARLRGISNALFGLHIVLGVYLVAFFLLMMFAPQGL